MARSGSAADSAFAEGFLAAIAQDKSLCFIVRPEHWRPISNLKLPLGQVEGDIGLLIRKPSESTNTLLVVEREGSAPGNERNILKWFEAVRGSYNIALLRPNQKVTCDFNRIILLLAFCRPSKWPLSDFQKTASFCEIFGTLVNQYPFGRTISFTTVCLKYPTEVADWRECGRHFGAEIIRYL
jgi:hypothetical protein